MERLVLDAFPRLRESKGALNRLRSEDRVPAVLYGRGLDARMLVVDGKSLRQVLSTGGSNALVSLHIKDTPTKGKVKQETVMFKEIQRDTLYAERILHVDFIRISMTEKVEVSVPLIFAGESSGVRAGGVLQILLREISVRCLPADIPESIEVDLSGLEIGDSLIAADIKLPAKIELAVAPEEPVVVVQHPASEEEAEPAAGEQPSEEHADRTQAENS